MKIRRIMSFILCFMMIVSLVPQIAYADTIDRERMKRQIHLYAAGFQGEDDNKPYNLVREENPAEQTNVYYGDRINVFMGVNDPNLGEVNDKGEHLEPRYDLSGYIVKLTYDTKYLRLDEEAMKKAGFTDPNTPFDYTYPERYGYVELGGGGDVDTDTDKEEDKEHPDVSLGFTSIDKGVSDVEGTTLRTVYAKVLLTGEYYPESESCKECWYNLFCLPLKAERTGFTEVWVDLYTQGEYDLELIAKNASGLIEEQTFELDVKNAGRHTILIQDRDKPQPPKANPGTGRYTEDQLTGISLYCEHIKVADPDPNKTVCDLCRVVYSTDPNAEVDKYTEYTKPITDGLNQTRTIYAYTQTKSNEQWSDRAEYTYTIIPEMPMLYDKDKKLISDYYYEAENFDVYGAVDRPYSVIPDDMDVYYTFAALDENDPAKIENNDPETQWVRLEKGEDEQKIRINKSRRIRLITYKTGEHSEIAEYYLWVKPKEVTPSLTPGEYDGAQEVKLRTETKNAVIYYTTDGTDPLTNGIKFDPDKAISLKKDTVIKAVACVDGHYGDTAVFDYQINYDDNGEITAIAEPGVYEGSVEVALLPNDPTKKIEYSIDGGKHWIPGNVLPEITSDTTVIARFEDDHQAKYEFEYTIVPKPPVFAPGSYQFTKTSDGVSIYCIDSYYEIMESQSNTKLYTLYYTKDGSDPTDENNTAVEQADDVSDSAFVNTHEDMTIKAVVKMNGKYSEVVTYDYEVKYNKPAKPAALVKSGTYNLKPGEKLNVRLAHVPSGTTLYYTTGDGSEYLEVPTAKSEKFPAEGISIDRNTAFKVVAINDYNKIVSEIASFDYEINYLAPATGNGTVTANYPSGMYIEREGESQLDVELSAQEAGSVIEYRIQKNDGKWSSWTEGDSLSLDGDTLLQARVKDSAETESYVYRFKPAAPGFEADKYSGAYTHQTNLSTAVELNSSTDKDDLWYRKVEGSDSRPYGGQRLEMDETCSYRAYARSKTTGRRSDAVVNYYIIEALAAQEGEVYIQPPYNKDVIYTRLLATDAYPQGIKLGSDNEGADIMYKYAFSLNDGKKIGMTNTIRYDGRAILINESFYDIDIEAWLVDELQTEISDTRRTFHIDFIGTPKPKESGKSYTLVNDYPTDKYTKLYYTLDDDVDPRDKENAKVYEGETFTTRKDKKIKTVYLRGCGNSDCSECQAGKPELCKDQIYGEVGTYTFAAYSSGGGGGSISGGSGGGGTIDNTKKYTKDIFGNLHPTHIGYINGYPDGSVQPDGNITREEVTSILYRIKNKQYEAPFVATGEVFPDVDSARWSVTDIEYMAEHNIVLGYPDGEFKPARKLTRAEFSALIRRFTGLDEPNEKNMFPDIEVSHWAYNDVMILTKAGLLQGYEDGTIRPEREISRAEVMTVVNKILGRRPDAEYVKSLGFNPFNDLDKSKWHYTTVLEATVTHDYTLNKDETLEIEWENWR